jgi:hypothetical protein
VLKVQHLYFQTTIHNSSTLKYITMGGKAFSTGPSPLFTPRLSPTLYADLVTHLTTTLQSLYTHVSTPPPAPSKSTHGDIDLLVCSPLTTPPPTLSTISSLFHAQRTISTSPKSYSLAIPHPELQDAYVQVDIRVCEDVKDWQWALFHHAYGDLWNLLGTMARPWGLTVNDKGLHLRIEEIESVDRKKSLVFLSREPDVVCEFLGMERERLGIDDDGFISSGDGEEGRGFGSMQEMYEMVVELRFFRREAYVRDTLKANDRKRMFQRDGYSKFVDEWLVRYKGLGGGKEGLTREGVKEDCFTSFGVRGEYERRVEEWRLEREALKVKREGREERKRKALEEEAYADAWIEILGMGRGTKTVKIGGD